MKLSPKSICSEFVNSDDEYVITYLMGAINLVYGTPKKKRSKGIAFKNTKLVREVANNLLKAADTIDIFNAKKDKANE